jgi:Domain of unknown function (DUF4279)
MARFFAQSLNIAVDGSPFSETEAVLQFPKIGNYFMEESLEPPLRLPPDKPVGEVVWVAGGEVDECSVTLLFRGVELVPDDITKVLGINPTRSFQKNDVSRGRIYDKLQTHGLWVYRCQRIAGKELETEINELLDQLPADLELWQNLTNCYGAELFCGLWLKRYNRSLSFSPQTLQRISERGLVLDLDVYFDLDGAQQFARS